MCSRRAAVRLLYAVLGCAVLAAACTNPLADSADGANKPRLQSEPLDRAGGTGPQDYEDAAAAGAGGPAAIGYVPEFSDGSCGFDVPPGTAPRCGVVAVPMDWQTGEGEIGLAVAVFASTADNPAPDPVIYLDGGPGSHSLDTITFVIEDFLEPLAERGDVIFFDQRGTGQTTPRLACTETEVISRVVEDDPSIGDEESTELLHDALRECRARLTGDGIDLTDYNSINNAHDVEALRLALGYDSFNLFGVSYGTKLGLEVLRRHPDGVRSAVLDSVYPPQVDSVLENPSTFLDSYQLMVDACAAEAACAADGDLAERIQNVIAKYEADPVEVEIRDWITDTRDDVYVTGETIVGIVVGALYSPSQFTDIPELITELENGETAAVITFLDQERTTERFFSNGMFYAFACNEEISFADPAEVAAGLPADPFGLKDGFDFASNTGNLAFGTCAAFDSGTAPAISNQAVASDVPSLLLAGTFDPVTPVSWAERAAESLSNSTLIVAPNQAHGVSSDASGWRSCSNSSML